MSLQRIGSRGATADFVRSLCVQLSPTLLPSSCVAALLELAAQPQTATSDAAFHAAVLQLLVASAQAAPSLFSDTADQVSTLLLEWRRQAACFQAQVKCLWQCPPQAFRLHS